MERVVNNKKFIKCNNKISTNAFKEWRQADDPKKFQNKHNMMVKEEEEYLSQKDRRRANCGRKRSEHKCWNDPAMW